MGALTRIAASLALALAALLSLPLPPPRPAAAQAGAPLLSSTPGALEATVALGETAALALELHNDSGAAVAPRLFEAVPTGSLPADAPPRPDHSARPDEAGPAAAVAAAGPRIDPQIALAQAADPAGEAEIIVMLDDQADLSAAYRMGGWVERGQYVYETLRAHAEASQHDLRATLEARGADYTPLWIVNAVAVRGSAADVAALAAERGVAAMWASRVAELGVVASAEPAQTAPAACGAGADNACWNIAQVGAGRVWADFGVQGEGITVANIDSGVRFDHPALVGQYRGSGPGGARHDYNWFDAYAGQQAPADAGNHGTHTMGTMVARGLSASQPAVGVAPGSRWIAVRACSARDCSEVDLIRAAQWVLAPTDLAGANPRPDLRPHVVNNSWTGGQNTAWYSGYVAAWRAAGIFPTFAAGNAGNLISCSTVQSPGDYAEVTAVGATDSAGRLATFSSIGPSLGGAMKPDLVAPGQAVYSTLADQRAYGTNSGTSMATPHVAGAVALLWAANPTLIGDYEATYAILAGSATAMTGDSRYMGPSHAACRPDSSPNNIYGHGRLDVYEAVARATVDVPWLRLPEAAPGPIAPAASATLSLTVDARMVPGPGTYQARVLVHGADLGRPPAAVEVTMHVPPDPSHAVVSGQVTRALDGAPLRATVQVAGGAAVLADADGRYSLTLPPAAAPYELQASARTYVAGSSHVQLEAGARATVDFALTADQPRLAADTAPREVELAFGERATVLLPVSNLGTQTLSYTVGVQADQYGAWRSDEADGPAHVWTDPPEGATTVALTDDGATEALPIGFSFTYFGRTYDELAILANGAIALAPLPPGELTFARTCLPLSETAGPAIAALRMDLDPSVEGARVSYARTPEGFLVSWENVPPYGDPGRRLSFQALLVPDGRISLRYKSVGDLLPAESASAGLQNNLAEVQSLGCKADLPVGDGLTVELRPQAPATAWLSVSRSEGSAAPAAQVEVPVEVQWVSTRTFERRLSGVVELRSNDPTSPVARFTVRLRTAEAPHTLLMPQVYTR